MRGSLRIGLLMVFALAGGHANAQVPIPVVHTWGDLQNAYKLTVLPSTWVNKGETPLVLAPVTFQVGIQSNQGTSYSGLLLYFIAPNDAWGSGTPEERGLYSVEVESKGSKCAMSQSAENFRGAVQTNTDGTTFYAETIPFGAAGDYVVKLVKPLASGSFTAPVPEILAQVTVHVSDHPPDLWYPLWETSDWSGGAPSGQNADGTRYAVVSVSNPKGGTAVPKPPRPSAYAQLPSPFQSLPLLISDVTDNPKVQIKMTDATLVVTFDQKLAGFFPDDNFLTRWWVNGQPVDLDPKLERPGQSRALAARVTFLPQIPQGVFGAVCWFTQEVHFQLDFQPDRLGVKKGDQVGVQLLFCPNGFVETGLAMDQVLMLQQKRADEPPPSSFSETSNRIDFTYSGDPKHPQQ